MTHHDIDITRGRAGLLSELADATARYRELTVHHEEYERKMVATLERAGATWAEIGHALGISRQAAWERFRGEHE